MKFIFAILGLWVFSCGQMERLDTTDIKEKMSNYKIKKISESEIMLSLDSLGNNFSAMVSDTNCVVFQRKLDSLNSLEGIGLTAIDFSNYQSRNGKEEQIIEAARYSMNQDEVFMGTPQKLEEDEYAYYFLQKKSKCTNGEKLFWKASVSKYLLIKTITQ